ncbi:MAG: hypothetical protein L0H53_07190 [Candidatus Nitrosocosmicus sp.]|nr:hypothetical protein [Candidatus Nitrosocosmicus sp.]MDN5867402.1 hypothetical protein [Candidatus Nitrosocosmicus sp.]
MIKAQNPEDNESAIRKIEGRILEKLFTQSNQQTPLTSDNELSGILTDKTDHSNFDIALENLIVGGFVSRIGDNEYQITMNGSDEHSKRTNADVLF